MAVSMIISLYSVRLVLASLGDVDYGIFNVIMGVVAMLSFLNGALTVSTQRYLSYYQGKNDKNEIISVFNHSLFLHALLGFIIVVLLEVGGGFILDNYLQIPEERMDTARIIFHFANLSVFFTFVSIPYTASINANEQMIFIALISILESFEKLFLAIYITYANCDRLLIYGMAMGGITILSFFMYLIICRIRYEECRHVTFRNLNKSILKDIGNFASWNLVGSFTSISKNQGIAVLFNMFRGPAVNAAYAVANQVSSQLLFFSVTMLRSINPQIMKSEGAGNRHRMLRLSFSACKYSFLLMSFFSIPCMFEMDMILGIWLMDVPEHTVLFCDFVLVAMMFDQLTVGINSAFQACKFVKQSSIYVGAVKILILPIGFLLLKMQMSVYWVVLLYALVELLAGGVRLYLAKHLMEVSIFDFYKDVVFRIFPPVICSIVVCLLIINVVGSPYRLIITIASSALAFLISCYVLSLDSDEKIFIKSLIVNIKMKCLG